MVSHFRLDGLAKRVSRDMELCEEYIGREDCLIEMSVIFGNIEKKFGPADSTKVRISKFYTDLKDKFY